MRETERRARVKNRPGWAARSAARGETPPRWSAERRASHAEGRKAPRKRLAYRVMIRPTGASHAPERLLALRPPLDSGEQSKDANPGRKHAPRERWSACCL